MNGNWEMRVDDAGKLVRWIEALRPDGSVAFSRVVEIVELNENFFTYRVPGADGAHVDIVHEPTDHPEPGAGGPDDGAGDTDGGTGGSDGSGGSDGGTGNTDGGTGSSAGGQQPGAEQGGADRADNAVTTPGAKVASQPAALATTGGGTQGAAAVGGLLALLSGAALLAARVMRLRRS